MYRSPVLGDQEEVPAGSLLKFTSPDEDYWQNPTAPQVATMYQSLPVVFDQVDFVTNVITVVDEDYWQNAVQPQVLTLYQPLPYFFDAAESRVVLDEDFWINQVAPVAASNQSFHQWAKDVPELLLIGQPDEDFWSLALNKITNELIYPQQWLFEMNEGIVFAPIPGSVSGSGSIAQIIGSGGAFYVDGSGSQLPVSGSGSTSSVSGSGSVNTTSGSGKIV